MAVEEIRGVTFDFDGERLDGWQAVQRLYRAGFTDVKQLAIGYAVMMGESGRYLRAWHHNVERNVDGTIARNSFGEFVVKSTDLGFIQKNIPHTGGVLVSDQGAPRLADDLFLQYPELARGDESAEIARNMYLQRGWQPWFAYLNGNYKRGLPSACVAVGNFIGMALVGDKDLVKLRGA